MPSSAAVKSSPRERIHKLLAIGVNDAQSAQAIINIKKQSKKSWEVLGVPQVTVHHLFKLVKGG